MRRDDARALRRVLGLGPRHGPAGIEELPAVSRWRRAEVRSLSGWCWRRSETDPLRRSETDPPSGVDVSASKVALFRLRLCENLNWRWRWEAAGLSWGQAV